MDQVNSFFLIISLTLMLQIHIYDHIGRFYFRSSTPENPLMAPSVGLLGDLIVLFFVNHTNINLKWIISHNAFSLVRKSFRSNNWINLLCIFSACKARGAYLGVHFKVGIYMYCNYVVLYLHSLNHWDHEFSTVWQCGLEFRNKSVCSGLISCVNN